MTRVDIARVVPQQRQSMQHLRAVTRTAVIAAALLSSLIPSSRIAAQADGTPIRVQTLVKKGKWITGRATGVTADSVGIVPDESRDTLRIAKSELHRLDVSVGRKSNAGRGALIGGAGGGGAMLALGVACLVATEQGDITGCGGEEVALFTLAGAASGAAVGALIGAFSHHEKWKAARLEPHASVDHRGVLHVGLGATF
jgi:hypothetical protein